jgi:rhodanese-related sulfurtransferase
MQQMTATQLKEWLDDPARDQPVLIDVREPWELDVCRIAGVKPMPMRSIPARCHELQRGAETVVVCHHGARSYQVCMFLEQQGFSRLFNLFGGMAAWSRDVDPTMPTY